MENKIGQRIIGQGNGQPKQLSLNTSGKNAQQIFKECVDLSQQFKTEGEKLNFWKSTAAQFIDHMQKISESANAQTNAIEHDKNKFKTDIRAKIVLYCHEHDCMNKIVELENLIFVHLK